jgi:hypothetical protein
LQREWRAEDVMPIWGALKPLLFCGTDGITRQFFGRPGKFSYKKHRITGSLYYQCQAEFRRSDTYAYSQTEWYVDFAAGASQVVQRLNGNAECWLRALISGPAGNPTITLGDKTIQIDTSTIYEGGIIPAGVVVEISSYPWERRVVDSEGLSLASYIVTDKPYLDTIRFPLKTDFQISWTATSTDANSKMRLLWHDAYQVMD